MGGNTNTGPIADKFFSIDHRENICSIIKKTSDREAFSTLLGYFNKVLSITQRVDPSFGRVNPEKFKKLSYALMIYHKQSFPWGMISPSVHQMCAHSWELFVLTDGTPIAIYSEQSGEAWNKYIRAYKSGSAARARQSSIKMNTRDIFTRMMIQSHPTIAAKKRQLLCSRCNRIGHTVRKCPSQVSTVYDAEQTEIRGCYY